VPRRRDQGDRRYLPPRRTSVGYVTTSSKNESSGVARPVLPTLKLGTYNGSSCLQTFLAKLENCSDYYDWSDKEKLCHLRASLEGPAGQALWDAGQQCSVKDIVRLLTNRFGSLNEEKRYRSELKLDVVDEASRYRAFIKTFDD
jgi:hypothetical protein